MQNVEINLGRTFSPKVSYYRPDGYGRDIYIHANSGGFKPYNTSLSPTRRLSPRAATSHN
jgi:hypothetical protein